MEKNLIDLYQQITDKEQFKKLLAEEFNMPTACVDAWLKTLEMSKTDTVERAIEIAQNIVKHSNINTNE